MESRKPAGRYWNATFFGLIRWVSSAAVEECCRQRQTFKGYEDDWTDFCLLTMAYQLAGLLSLPPFDFSLVAWRQTSRKSRSSFDAMDGSYPRLSRYLIKLGGS